MNKPSRLCLIAYLGLAALKLGAVEPPTSHYVPAEKNLTDEWLDALHEQGQRKVYRGEELLAIGMPCGGIGAGQLYVRGDGTLARWWIFGEKYITDFRRRDPKTGYRTYRPPSEVEQGFAISVESANGGARTLPLSHDGFDQIGFYGEYPIATIQYDGANEKAWPVEITGEVFSPYLPLNAKESGLPATVLQYTVKNCSAELVRFRIGGWLQNKVLPSTDDSVLGQRRNQVVHNNRMSAVVFDVIGAAPNKGIAAQSAPDADSRNVLIEDFESPIVRPDGTSVESGSLERWQVEGSGLFAKAPRVAGLTEGPLSGLRGFKGEHLLSSGGEDPAATGTMTSEEFVIEEPYLSFSIGSVRRERWMRGASPELRLVVDGEVVRAARSDDEFRQDKQLRTRSWNVRELVGKRARLVVVDENRTRDLLIDDFQQSSFNPQEGGVLPTWAPGFGDMTLAYLGERGVASATSDAGPSALATIESSSPERSEQPMVAKACGSVASPLLELAPGEEKSVCFVVGWYFPNYENNQKGCPGDVGRMYSNWFENSQEVVAYIALNFDRLNRVTHEFRDAMYLDTTLPYWLVQRAMAPNSNLASASIEWWKNGRMYSWEGVGFCLGTCGHVWNYAQGPSRLFPELERSVRRMQDFHPEVSWKPSGRINFRGYNDPGESFEHWGYIPDAQSGYVLKAYREHLMSADNSFLDELWPRIKRSTEYLIERDGRYGEVNGILEGLQHLTDSLAWGPNTFTGALYLAALRASEEMAMIQGDEEFAAECRHLFEAGRKWTLNNLWNGEYFVHKYTPAPKGGLPNDGEGRAFGDGCLSDQMFGQNWAHQLGLGYLYPPDRVKESLRSVYRYNWAPDVGEVYKVRRRRFILLADPGEPGLMGCTFPHGAPKNMIHQNEDPWTGYEYQSASGMLWEGLLDDGLSIAYGVHQRYQPDKHNPWNEIEGGDHYSRSMASWGLLLAVSGYEYDGPAGKIGFAPNVTPTDFRCLFTAARAWGSLAQQRTESSQTNRIEVRWGKLKTKTLVFEVPQGTTVSNTVVRIGGRVIGHEINQGAGRLTLQLSHPAHLQAGQAIEVLLTFQQ